MKQPCRALRFPYVVVGGGVAGLTFALEVASTHEVAVLFKKQPEYSSTAWAQGGIAAVTSREDSYDAHIQDTLRAGAGLCHTDIVEIVVREGPERVEELIRRGTRFDHDTDGYHLHQEGGHSKRRIYHAADATGFEIQRALLAAAQANPNIHFLVDYTAIDLITTEKMGLRAGTNRVVGLYALSPNGQVQTIEAKKVLVAAGGAGKVYLYTSNPDVATGDGIAMCFRAGAPVGNMEFFQFHPTCLYHPEAKSFLITEAMRGEGAHLLRVSGDRFMPAFHQDAELAPRDIVARSIDRVMKEYGEDHVLLDISFKPSTFILEHFPNIYHRCLEFGFDITKGPIPVVPAAHYCCGGVVTDSLGRTSIENLYVAGESAHTGLHGANRLASNSLLEGLVFAHRAAQHARGTLPSEESQMNIPEWDSVGTTDSDEAVVITQNWDEVRRLMWNYVGIVRSTKRLERALHRIELIQEEIRHYYWDFTVTPDLIELRNLTLVAELVVRSALKRKESRGLHYTLDFPNVSEAYASDTIIEPQEKTV